MECLLGDFMTDAMLSYRRNLSATADFALINSGGIRATIDVGPITRGEVLTSFPFGNAIVELELSGDELWKTLEGVMTKVNQYNNKAVTSFIQISKGITISYNPENNNGSKLVEVIIGDKPLDMAETYNVVTLDFLAGGGDNIFQTKTEFVTLDTQDAVLTQYILSESPVDIALDGRIKMVNGTTTTPSGTATGSGASSSPTGGAGSITLARENVVLLFGVLLVGGVYSLL
jgi:2',3'-cyclic-nucleotide 2'-phosphodiesterase (5'-nucleotidase family)